MPAKCSFNVYAGEILQLELEISSYLEVLYKKSFLENFSKFTGKHKKQSDALKNFAKFTEEHLCRSLFFNKVAA